ncbi:MAG: PCMD domain-containing protein [Bacteroidaceae bacterium]|nr:PCMD domain-containing protein [Bacteroidaceae bacterium]
MKRIIFTFLLLTSLLSCTKEKDIFDNYNQDDEGAVVTKDGQLYNMNFDLWCKDGSYYECYGENASSWQKSVWGSANSSTAKLGKSTCIPETDFLALSGEGKHAVMLRTEQINAVVAKKLAAGSIFTGQMGSVSLTKLSASLKWGIPFTLRPVSLEGYACYKPVNIDVVKSPYEDSKGTLDNGHVFVLLTDWEKQFTVDPASNKFVDIDNDPNIIGYGKVTFDHTMDDYEKFNLTIDYRNDRTPKYVVIVASSSALGDYFTGGRGSTLYLDEFKFIY